MSSHKQKFDRFIEENPRMYELFKQFAHEAINAGRKVLSTALIVERIRWETQVVTTGDVFKINNNHQPHFARKFMEDHPQYAGIFRTRVCTSI